jgi:hypothetical protein
MDRQTELIYRIVSGNLLGMWDLIENIINNHMEYFWEHQIPKKTPSTSSLQPFPPNSGLIFGIGTF